MYPVTRGLLGRFALAACAASLMAACAASDVTGPATANAPSFSGGSGGGGGGGGGTSTATTCSNIRKFDPKPGYYPGSKVWGAIWITVDFRSCDGSAITAVLKGTRLGQPGPDAAFLPGANTTGFFLGSPDGIAYSLTSGATIDWEPIELEQQFQVELEIHNSAGSVIETASAIVTTPAPILSTSTTTP
jgi:opacity protein-like surface antigen